MTATSCAETTNPLPLYRQGDVLLVGPAKIPDTATQIARDPERGTILQEGKVTHHAHRIVSPVAAMFELGDARYLRLVEPADLVHDEHDSIALPAGDYQIVIHHEYEPGAIARQVED
jgi:hypothetical protein